MAVRAVYHGCHCHRRLETGDVPVHAWRHNGMKREGGWVEFQTGVRLGYLSGYRRFRSVRIIRVAFEADFIFVLSSFRAAPGGRHAGDSAHRAGRDRGFCRRILHGMRIMTIDAFDVHNCRRGRFFQIVNALVSSYIVPAELEHLGL